MFLSHVFLLHSIHSEIFICLVIERATSSAVFPNVPSVFGFKDPCTHWIKESSSRARGSPFSTGTSLVEFVMMGFDLQSSFGSFDFQMWEVEVYGFDPVSRRAACEQAQSHLALKALIDIDRA